MCMALSTVTVLGAVPLDVRTAKEAAPAQLRDRMVYEM